MGWTPPSDSGIDVPEWRCHRPLKPKGASTMQITTVGIDLAKNVFQVHGMDERGKAVLRKHLRRDHVAAFFANLPRCLIGMEACGGAHHWARKLEARTSSGKLATLLRISPLPGPFCKYCIGLPPASRTG